MVDTEKDVSLNSKFLNADKLHPQNFFRCHYFCKCKVFQGLDIGMKQICYNTFVAEFYLGR